MRTDDFAGFYNEAAPSLYTFGFLLAGTAGEDLAAEAFSRALARWSEVSSYDRPDAWVRRVMINLLISQRRKQQIQSLFRDRFRDQIDSASHADRVETELVVKAALDRLPPRQRAVVILRYFESCSLEETARALRCSVSTANTHLRRARAALGAVLGEAILDNPPTGTPGRDGPSLSPTPLPQRPRSRPR